LRVNELIFFKLSAILLLGVPKTFPKNNCFYSKTVLAKNISVKIKKSQSESKRKVEKKLAKVKKNLFFHLYATLPCTDDRKQCQKPDLNKFFHADFTSLTSQILTKSDISRYQIVYVLQPKSFIFC
jgi:hypothetical protein